MFALSDVLIFINDLLQAAVVIFGASVVLYNLRQSVRDRITRAFVALVSCVVIVYLTELLLNYAISPASIELWLRIEWIGIALVPPTLFHLSDALLVATGLASQRRRVMIYLGYLGGLLFLGLVLTTDWLVGSLVNVPRAPHLLAGPGLPIFAAYFWLTTVASIYNVWRARQRCLIKVTRYRMSIILGAVLAAPLGVYPYLLVSDDPNLVLPPLFWLVLIAGNVVVSILFAMLTLQLVYFGASSPDRVVRGRLYKYMARVPLAATLVLIAYLLINRTGSFLGLPTETAAAFAIVATVIVVEWAVHTFKLPLQRVLQLDQQHPDVRRIVSLSERLVTTQELRDFLESILAAACDALRTPSAFIVSFMATGPQLEMVVGPLPNPDELVQDGEIWQLAQTTNRADEPAGETQPALDLRMAEGLILWQNYWIQPLYDSQDKVLLGILGIEGRADTPDFSEQEWELFAQLAAQAASALEDRILQQEVFAAVENLLPQLTALQKRRSAATFGGAPALVNGQTPINDPQFSHMVKDALSHYWGGPKLTESPLLQLHIVQETLRGAEDSPINALRHILQQAIEKQRPQGERSLTRSEWVLYNILELKFVQGRKVREVARRLAMSESDLYRKQRVAIENVARAIEEMERDAGQTVAL